MNGDVGRPIGRPIACVRVRCLAGNPPLDNAIAITICNITICDLKLEIPLMPRLQNPRHETFAQARAKGATRLNLLEADRLRTALMKYNNNERYQISKEPAA